MKINSSLRRRLFFISIITVILASQIVSQTKNKLPYMNPGLSPQERVADLLGRMTIEEKIAQLQCVIEEVEGRKVITEKGLGGIAVILRPFKAREAAEKANRIQKIAAQRTRLGIPILIHDEALHGLIGEGATSFPQAIGLASTWDVALMGKIATVIGKETRSRGIRQVLSPVVNIARDVRWGRVEETYGEDPYLASRMGVAFCKGIENEGVITTPKHFALNTGDGGRDSHPVHTSERLLREVEFAPFKACIKEAHAGSVMAAYNSLDGVPCSANSWLLDDVLRKEWGFGGFVVSDYGSVGGIMSMHHTAGTEQEVAIQAINAGLDMELPGTAYYGNPLLQAVTSGLVDTETVNNAAARILASKFRLGMFDKPSVDPAEAEKINSDPESRKLALQAAQEAIVLLKNEEKLLPFRKELKSIAVIGPTADAVRLGGYSGSGMKVVTILEGIKNKISQAAKVSYAKGCDLGGMALPQIPPEYLVPAGGPAGSHGLKGEYFNSVDLSGKPVMERIDEGINFDWATGSPSPEIHADSFSARWTGKLLPPVSGRYKISVSSDDGIRLYVDGKLLVDSWFDRGEMADYVSLKLEGGRQYDIRIEYYENKGYAAARLGWDFKKNGSQEIQAAAELAKHSDAAVIAVGILEGEGWDRADLNLPAPQEELIKAVAATGTPTVVVLIGGSAVTMNGWIDDVRAVVEAWYAGEEGGNAIADVLFGNYNPGGKLPITFPQTVGQVPLYYNTKPSGRGYDYVSVSGKPLFPFGYGLSYTDFAYSNLQISPTKASPEDTIRVMLDLKNTGNRRGDEVVQLYLHDKVSSVSRPLKELKNFKRITLEPGEKKTVGFELTGEDLTFLDKNMKNILEPGKFEVMIGSSSDDIRLQSSFEIEKR